jgi:hypothetical protein
MTAEDSPAEDDMNWPAIGALYAALGLGIGALLHAGQYRNAAWLGLIGAGGACTAYGRVLEQRGVAAARWWKRGGALFYAAFFVWAGTVLLQTL